MIDHKEFCRLLEEIRPRLLGWARKRTKSDAEDLVQDTLLLALSNWQQFNPARGSLKSWLSLIMRNRFIDQVRTPRARATHVSFEEACEEGRAQEPYQEKHIRIMEGARWVSELAELPRETIRLTLIGYTDSEIAHMRKLPHGSVKSHIQKSRTKFLQELAP